MKTKELAYCAIAVALLALCSWISIPMSVPFTLQTFAVFLLTALLRGKLAFISICVYLLLGMLGIPVFAGFRGGPDALFGVTGGYLIGFLFSTLFLWGSERLWKRSRGLFVLCCIVALLICYAFGTCWFLAVYARNAQTISIAAVLGMCVIPFLLPDLLKILAAAWLSEKLRFIIR